MCQTAASDEKSRAGPLFLSDLIAFEVRQCYTQHCMVALLSVSALSAHAKLQLPSSAHVCSWLFKSAPRRSCLAQSILKAVGLTSNCHAPCAMHACCRRTSMLMATPLLQAAAA